MSTFFEKITGYSGEEQPMPQLAASPALSQKIRAPRKQTAALPTIASLEQATNIKTENELAALPPREALPEDEGELTVDIYDTGDAIVIQSTVAGVKPEDLDVSITSDSVTIRGRRMRPETVQDHHYYYKELFWGIFSRSVILPEEIDENATEATLKLGLLTIRLPKKQRGAAQKIKVKMA